MILGKPPIFHQMCGGVSSVRKMELKACKHSLHLATVIADVGGNNENPNNGS
jgi:hypothetical protein